MVSGYSTSTNLPRVDGLSTDPRDLGRHIRGLRDEEMAICGLVIYFCKIWVKDLVLDNL